MLPSTPAPDTRHPTPDKNYPTSENPTLQIGNISLSPEQLLPLVSKYRLVPQLAKEMIIDDVIKEYEISQAEHQDARQRFCLQQQLSNDRDLELWLQQQKLSERELTELIDRELKLQKFKTSKWETLVESYFCQRKSQIDRVVFSMIRVKDIDVAEEIYFRLAAEESTFVELSPLYSQGIEAKTKGISGPVELGKLDPLLANALITLQPEEVHAPLAIGEWWVILQLETFIRAELDDELRHYLTEELFNQWIAEEVQKFLSMSPETPSIMESFDRN